MNQTESLEGETLDFVVFRSFGYVDSELMDKTYRLNPELMEYGIVLPAGTIVILPELPKSTEKPTLHLWD